MSDTNDKLLLSLKDASALMGVSYELLYSQARRGKVPALRIGNRWFVTRAWIDNLVEQHSKVRPPDPLPPPRILAAFAPTPPQPCSDLRLNLITRKRKRP